MIEVLMVIGVMAVVSTALANLLNSQQRSIQFLAQKQEIVDMKNIMLTQLARADVCSWQLAGRTFDASMPTSETNPSPAVVALLNNTIYHGLDQTSAAIAAAGQPLPGTLTGVRINAVSFRRIFKANDDVYKGVFEVSFNGTVTPANAVQVSQVVRTVVGSPDNAKVIQDCVGSAGGASGSAVLAYGEGIGDSTLAPLIVNFTIPREGVLVASAELTYIGTTAAIRIGVNGGSGCGNGASYPSEGGSPTINTSCVQRLPAGTYTLRSDIQGTPSTVARHRLHYTVISY